MNVRALVDNCCKQVLFSNYFHNQHNQIFGTSALQIKKSMAKN
jgi:hypothetical protein